jgi:uncharacterized membrane protein YfcA
MHTEKNTEDEPELFLPDDEEAVELPKDDNVVAEALLAGKKRPVRKWFYYALYAVSALLIVLTVCFYFDIINISVLGRSVDYVSDNLDSAFLTFILVGFLAQMIDGALGMAYGVSVTSFLMAAGIPGMSAAVASASMHAAEIFTTGSSSLVYMRYKNVNKKLFKMLFIPGALGAIGGAITISFVSKDNIMFVKPFVAAYTLVLGVLIVRKALNLHIRTRKKVRKFRAVALAGGFLDSVGGGGWGPIVTTTLIAAGRDFRYAVGSSHVAKFFVALISTITFFSVLGFDHLKIIFGLIVGSMIAVPISINLANKISKKYGLILVGSLVILISLRTILITYLK